MSNVPINTEQPGFMGRDKVVPFIGQVENVNDKKYSNRVQVRIVGLHPWKKNGGKEDSLKTEDLPWARVGFPSTMSQQARVGGTHGMQPGAWVYGVFLDGADAQEPLVICSFNHTAKASDQYNRQNVDDDEDGESESIQSGYTKQTNLGDLWPNQGLALVPEQSNQAGAPADPSADVPPGDGVSPCTKKDDHKSKASFRDRDECRRNGNEQAQCWDDLKADGLCGPNRHAKDDIKSFLRDGMPSQMDRLTFGDAVWDKMLGSYIELNPVLKQQALTIANTLKRPIESFKAEKMETKFRMTRSQIIKAYKDRDAFPTIKQVDQLIKKDDVFHGMFQKGFIDILLQLVFSLLQGMNNSGGGGGGGDDQSGGNQGGGQQAGGNQGQAAQNIGNNPGAFPNTKIQNPAADCVAETLIEDIYILCNDAFNATEVAATQSAKEAANPSSGGGSGGGGGGGSSAISAIMGLLKQAMKYPLEQMYAQHDESLNKAGDKSQDVLTKEEGCNEDRIYNTEKGDMAGMAGMAAALAGAAGGGGGGSGGGGGGGSGGSGTASPGAGTPIGSYGGGSTSYSNAEQNQFIGFAGHAGECDETKPVTVELCEDAYTYPLREGISPEYRGFGPTPDLSDAEMVPSGTLGAVVAASLPSGDEVCGVNFIQGVPNQIVVQRTGRDYYFKNPYSDEHVFPTIYIPGYRGTPVPVIDKETGELVSILTTCAGFNPDSPSPPVTIQPNDSTIGILSSDPNYDIILSGFFILNTGFDYCDPEVLIYDKDREDYNGKVKVTVVDGRIVDYTIEDPGNRFFRIPKVQIKDTGKPCGTQGGWGAKILPIMGVIPRAEAPPLPPTLNMVFCPAKQQINSVESTPAEEILTASLASVNSTTTPTTVPNEGVQPASAETTTATSEAQARLAQAQTGASSTTSSTTNSTSSGTSTSSSSSSSSTSNVQQQSSQSYGGGY